MNKTGTVWFVGAGPGDPELLTLKGQKRIAGAELVLYAGSLVPLEVLACAKEAARLVDSSGLTLEECHDLLRETVRAGNDAARVHTGDPSLFGAIREQIRLLEADGIAYGVVPGVTAACAAAAAAGISFTVPDVTQSLILTRMEGRTPVPEKEKLRRLADHGCSLAVYLSAAAPEALQEELAAALPLETPVLCACRVGWPDQRLIWSSVGSLAAAARAHELTRQTVFLVLPGQNAAPTASKLYDAAFSHGWRQEKR